MSWSAWAGRQCDEVRGAGRWRAPRALDGAGCRGVLDGREVVSFASNDYLGLTTHPSVLAAAHDALDRWGTGAGSARLVVGSRPVHHDLERALAEWKSASAAALFPSGFMANLAVLSVVAGPGVTVLSDELNHASIIDGCRLARAAVQVYRHRDLEHVAELLASTPGRVLVVTESVFSMDGDAVDVSALADLCVRFGALLVVDEEHGVLAPAWQPTDVDVLRVGTLSKALASVGGYVAGPRPLVDLLVNRARPYIFTTALPPADAAAAFAALEVVRSTEGEALRVRLRSLVDRVRPGQPSAIVPVVLGSEDAALAAAARLLDAGLLVPAIRPPTVPAGTSRLRVALCAAHTDAEVDRLVNALGELRAAA